MAEPIKGLRHEDMGNQLGSSGIRKLVVIGDGIAGIAAAQQARRLNGDCEICVISRRSDEPIKQGRLDRWFNGRPKDTGKDESFPPDSWYRKLRIIRRPRTRAVAIDTDRRQVVLEDREHVGYERLILATGGCSRTPTIGGFGAPGSFVLHDTCDVTEVREYIQRSDARTAIVADASAGSLEAAQILRRAGLKVIVIASGDHLLTHHLDACGSRLVHRHLASQGIEVLTGIKAASLRLGRDGRIQSITLNDGRVLPTGIVLAKAAVQPDMDLAKSAGIVTRNGVLVDDYMQTSHEDVYAAGEVAEHDSVTACRRPQAAEQGRIAAINALGGRRRYRGDMPSALLRLTGFDLMSVGQIDGKGNGVYSISDEQPGGLKYRKLIFTAGQLLGAILIGYPDDAALVSSLVEQKADLTPVISALYRGNWNALTQLELAALARRGHCCTSVSPEAGYIGRFRCPSFGESGNALFKY